ncbi:MAG: dual specificity protein phosphatase family protein [Acidimicrobiales bacterium]
MTPVTRSVRPRARVTAILRRGLIVAAAFFLLPNLAVLGAHLLAQRGGSNGAFDIPVRNFAEVDDRLWRGAAPDADGYRALAAAGVQTVVDLRAEENLHIDNPLLRSLGITRVALPMRDGQAPTRQQVDRFLDIVQDSPGRVFVHCGAGVGRTGTMAAAYLVKSGQAGPVDALRRNLSIGPPSLEQMAFSAGLDDGAVRPPATMLVALSRTLDAPRRLWVNLRG